MTVETFKLPDVGEGVAEGELVRWLVEDGQEIEEDQPLAEVETDKALVDLPSPFAGTVTERHAEEGEMVPVGTVLVSVDVGGDEDEGVGDAEPEPEPEPEPESETTPTDAAADDGSEAAIALPDVPRQYLIIGSVGLLALGAIVAGVMVLTGPTAADQLTVTGEGYSQGQTIFVDATVENIGEQTQTATLSVETSFGGEVSQGFSTSREVTVTGGERATETVALGEFGDLTATQEQALQSGDFRIDFKIDGQTKDTYTE